ncbi:AbrB/MazE/SpoVT family DNA-binding domain-containing protein [Acinetobacter sp. VNH17]|uniref:AbrB/MazE/SpoVT family DNA-binding domain-containing protein n=1 Tax=Acinetobacter thutiue TaxID=2998078 RepID=A0ABT7WKC0_9GAMM|nr:AbrB/MazE/SpoVT family DNA-binding domain-containing protein [Acinetobacter thutiue]MCY6411032.1 AbrB/MazE/SpoVT family DNA-binding domain-containing protein [Acinetobacter thutiue]MDN0013134.1 AbrB/MazE/SpoVT family DNA-binding domain-containing protein [Acinetobacter thutiue]
MSTPITSRVFMNGNSQAVRIPQEFRLNTKRVEIFLNQNGDLVIHPIAESSENRGEALWQALQEFDTDFVEILEKNRLDDHQAQERDAL